MVSHSTPPGELVVGGHVQCCPPLENVLHAVDRLLEGGGDEVRAQVAGVGQDEQEGHD